MKVTKLKNFNGYYYNCSCCGKKIKHPFRIDGGDNIYGEQCAINLGYNSSKVLKQVKQHKNLIKCLNNITDYNMKIYMEFLNMSKEQVLDYFYEKGEIRL